MWVIEQMKNVRIALYELEDNSQQIKDYLIDYISECAKARISLIRDGEIGDVVVAIKGEIAMAAMEGRIDLSRDLSERCEELACLAIDIKRLEDVDVEQAYFKT